MFFIHGQSFSQDTTKVLFIGNSFMRANNLPLLFSNLAAGAGEKVLVAAHVPGGASVGDTIQGTFAHMYNPVVYALIKSNDWNYVFLQDRQSRFAMSQGIFPGDSRVIEGHFKLRDSVLFYHPCAKMVWFAGFGTKNGYPPYSTTGVGLIDSIYQNYLVLEDTAGQVIAPIGPAYKSIIAGYPSIDLWAPDGEHPSLSGSLLISSVLYSTVLKSSPALSPYNPGIPMQVDSLLKSVGYQTTLDSLDFTGLSPITPEILRAGNLLFVNGYPLCRWFCNKNSVASINCTTTVNQAGYYHAVVEDDAGCPFRTFAGWHSPGTGVREETGSGTVLNVFPNPASTSVTVFTNVDIHMLSIFNTAGDLMKRTEHAGYHAVIDVSALPAGLYCIRACSPADVWTSCRFIKR